MKASKEWATIVVSAQNKRNNSLKTKTVKNVSTTQQIKNRISLDLNETPLFLKPARSK